MEVPFDEQNIKCLKLIWDQDADGDYDINDVNHILSNMAVLTSDNEAGSYVNNIIRDGLTTLIAATYTALKNSGEVHDVTQFSGLLKRVAAMERTSYEGLLDDSAYTKVIRDVIGIPVDKVDSNGKIVYSSARDDLLSFMSVEGQCEAVSKVKTLELKCWICGVKITGGYQKNNVECEHVLPIGDAMLHLALVQGAANFKITTSSFQDIVREEYEWSHRCCNRIKDHISLVTPNGITGKYEVNTANIDKMCEAIVDGIDKDHGQCAHLLGKARVDVKRGLNNTKQRQKIGERLNRIVQLINGNIDYVKVTMNSVVREKAEQTVIDSANAVSGLVEAALKATPTFAARAGEAAGHTYDLIMRYGFEQISIKTENMASNIVNIISIGPSNQANIQQAIDGIKLNTSGLANIAVANPLFLVIPDNALSLFTTISGKSITPQNGFSFASTISSWAIGLSFIMVRYLKTMTTGLPDSLGKTQCLLDLSIQNDDGDETVVDGAIFIDLNSLLTIIIQKCTLMYITNTLFTGVNIIDNTNIVNIVAMVKLEFINMLVDPTLNKFPLLIRYKTIYGVLKAQSIPDMLVPENLVQFADKGASEIMKVSIERVENQESRINSLHAYQTYCLYKLFSSIHCDRFYKWIKAVATPLVISGVTYNSAYNATSSLLNDAAIVALLPASIVPASLKRGLAGGSSQLVIKGKAIISGDWADEEKLKSWGKISSDLVSDILYCKSIKFIKDNMTTPSDYHIYMDHINKHGVPDDLITSLMQLYTSDTLMIAAIAQVPVNSAIMIRDFSTVPASPDEATIQRRVRIRTKKIKSGEIKHRYLDKLLTGNFESHPLFDNDKTWTYGNIMTHKSVIQEHTLTCIECYIYNMLIFKVISYICVYPDPVGIQYKLFIIDSNDIICPTDSSADKSRIQFKIIAMPSLNPDLILYISNTTFQFDFTTPNVVII